MKRLLIIHSGPTYSIKENIYTKLSEYFSGDILTSSSKQDILQIKQISNFKFNCLFLLPKKSIFSLLKYVSYCLKFVLNTTYLHREKIDLVITYDPLKTGLIGILCAFFARSKLLIEVNGVYTSPFVYMDEKSKFLAKIKYRVYPLIAKIVLSNSDGIRLLFKEQIDSLNIRPEKKSIRVFPCEVNIEPFLEYPIDINKEEVLFIGYPHFLKGVDLLIDAFKVIAPQFPSWRLKILGWYPDLSVITSAIAGHPQIFHHRPVFAPEVPFHMSCCSIFVLPSRTEAMGRVLVEAAAAGKALIGSNVEGIPTVIDNNVNGLLFQKENTQDLSDKLVALMSNPDLRLKFATNARQKAQDKYSTQEFIRNTTLFYKDVLLK